MLKNKFVLGAGSLVAVTIVIGAFLTSFSAYADEDVVDNVNIEVPVSCSLEGTGMTSHNANIVNGTYQPDIGSTTLKAFCNDSNGFAIYAIGFSNEEYGNTNLIGASSSTNIVTGTATSAGNPDTSNWAMKLATEGTATYPITLDNSFNAYHAVPTTYTKVAHRDGSTDIGTGATGATLTSTYAAYISKTQNADSYNGKVKYTIVHPASETPLQPVACEAGKICYQPNTGTALGEMGKQFVNTTLITLWSSNFKRDGYGFAGWNDKYDYSGTNYGPNQTITAPADVQTNGLSLYAVWIKSAGSLQNWDGCDSLAQGATTALTDERDGNTYAVAKLADGKCWAIENLRLDDSAELSLSNTHNPSLPLTNDYEGTITSNHLSTPINPRQQSWCTWSNESCDGYSQLATNNTTLFIDNSSSSYSAFDSDVYSHGNYYNWYSATAGHGTYFKSSDSVVGDICPAGWHLPTGKDASGEFGLLDVAFGGTGTDSNSSSTPTGSIMSGIWRSYPNNFVYSGAISKTNIYTRGAAGYYVSATASDNERAYCLGIGSTTVSPGTSTVTCEKNGGFTIRCISDSQ